MEKRPDCGRLPGMASDRCGAIAKFPSTLEVSDCRRVTIERLRAALAERGRIAELQGERDRFRLQVEQ